jgi:4-amino-4-deoxy-L-arabinose transferase-like glycosyltransferase
VIGLTLAGLVLRLVYVTSQRDLIVGGDGWHYHVASIFADKGQWFEHPNGGPDAHHPPLWTAMLSLVATLGGRSWFSQQIFSAFVGVSVVPLIALAGRKIAGPRVGLVAAGMAAVYPGMWQYERELLSEVVLMPLLALVLYLVYRYKERPSLLGAIVLSATCALLSLARAEQVALFLLVVTPLVLGTRSIEVKRRVGRLAAAAVVAIVLFAPWAVYNTTRFEEPVVLSVGLGPTMSAGACEETLSGDLIGYYSNNCNYRRIPFVRDLDRSEGDLKMRSLATDYTRDHRDQLPAVVLAREARTFGFFKPVQEVELGSEWSKSPEWVGYTWTVLYWLLLPLGVLGAVVVRRRRILLYPLLAEFVIVAVSAATTFGQIRYRAGAEVPLLILASVAVDALWRRWRRSASERVVTSDEPAAVEPQPVAG